MLEHNASLTETVELYQSVPGVGQLTAATLVAYLPELGRWDGRTLTSLVGLAPWSRDCGKKHGNVDLNDKVRVGALAGTTQEHRSLELVGPIDEGGVLTEGTCVDPMRDGSRRRQC